MRFFGRLAWSIISLLTITLAMLFATSNTQIASLQLWPLAGSIDLPIWVIVLGALGAGAIIGGGRGLDVCDRRSGQQLASATSAWKSRNAGHTR